MRRNWLIREPNLHPMQHYGINSQKPKKENKLRSKNSILQSYHWQVMRNSSKSYKVNLKILTVKNKGFNNIIIKSQKEWMSWSQR
jgi:hypothetical protein